MSNIKNADLKRRIIDLSYKHKLSHIGSCLTAVDILDDIYQVKQKDEKFVLSQGHAGLALYVVLEKHLGFNAELLLQQSGTHPTRYIGENPYMDVYPCIDCSTGSLGHGFAISLGLAMADRKKNVYSLISDGEISEGIVYETIKIRREYDVQNLKVYINANGYSAYSMVEVNPILEEDAAVYHTDCDYIPFLKGLEGHYHVMDECEYKTAMEILK